MDKTKKRNTDFSFEELEYAAKIAARIVAMYGERYLPIFNRVHDELIQAKESQNQKALALQIALSYNEGR